MSNGNDFFPWGDINENEEWPTGIYHARIMHTEDTTGSNSGKRMARIGFQSIAPSTHAGLSHFENYVLGTDEQPMAINKDSMGAKNLKKMCKAAQISEGNSLAGILASAMNAELLVAMKYKPDSDFKNNITNYFRLGEREPMVAPQPGQAPGMPQAMPAAPPAPPVAAPMAPAPPVMPAQPMPAAPAVPAPPAAAPAPPVQPMAPPAPPVMPAAPVAPQAPPVPPAATAAPALPPIQCTICGESVPAMELGVHIQTKHAS